MVKKVNGESVDITKQNIERLKELFPEVFTDGEKIDFDMLKTVLGEVIDDNHERYQFTWHGKKQAILGAQKPSKGTLRPVPEKSKNFDTTENLYIEGDNLEVLKLLQKSYNGKIKVIYIDPPYNTGNDFIYKDNFTDGVQNYLEQTGQVDSEGNQLSTNTESNGRFHTEWLNMMYPRLKLARNLLSDDGAIFIHIDDNELANLKKICDEIFWPQNHINTITVKTKVAGVSGSHMGKSLQNNAEYILFYCKNINSFLIDNPPKKRQELYSFIKGMEESGKSWKYTSVITELDEGEYVKTIKAGNGDEIRVFKHSKYSFSSVSRIANEEFNGDIKSVYYKYINKIFRTTNAQSSIRKKVMEETQDIDSDLISIEYIPTKGKNAGKVTRLYYKDKVRNLVAFLNDVVSQESDAIYKLDNKGNIWDDINYNNLANEAGITFPNGQKPVRLIRDLIEMFNDKDAIIMDFFSGSATTAHATMQLNAEDGGNRKFIMVQLDEPLDEKSDEYKAGFKTICDIGQERIRRSGEKIKQELLEKQKKAGMLDKDVVNPDSIDTGFKVLKLDKSNIREWNVDFDNLEFELDLYETPFIEDRNELDVVYEIMLKYGLELTYPINTFKVDGKNVYDIAFGNLFICLDKDINTRIAEAIIAKRDEYGIETSSVVFSDAGFAGNDSEKLNCIELLKDAGYSEDSLLTI
ncbi:site-specific DNA-methyltransferase [Globicatella sulfidifaciens]|uniref:Site-specific DNA-methyltransferase n=1 Tax=Globicatella sulfidifaciens TaxID=136093 RepID=A0A7X8C2A5_9LACT|nr:site-specific DNA-methyltransferase [Globicatella sulfidifaciens]NLJ17671.1 site-specific DNA-methyltransferase [Globicatella sulfidifaciens]